MISPTVRGLRYYGPILLLVAPILACPPSGGNVALASRPECPAHEFEVTLTDSVRGQVVSRAYSEVPVAGPLSDVPEYHDCQRLALGNSRRFGPLVAIFASNQLDSLLPVGDSGQRPVIHAAAEILSYDGRYVPLHIEKGFNCLHLRKIGNGWEARITPVGLNAEACLEPFDANAGFPLRVQELPHRLEGEHVPPVARWDWDPGSLRHYIGIKCGDHWCEVGNRDRSKGHRADTMPPPRPVPGKPAPSDEKRVRVVEIKGWYDEQRLAVPNQAGELAVTDLEGTLIPHATLHDLTAASDFRGWAPVATVTLNAASADYKHKLNLDSGINFIEFCAGPMRDCIPPGTTPSVCKSASDGDWWARIISASGDTAYKCVVRRQHPGAAPPATARWRWLEDDETMWIRCPGGCCTLER